MTILDFLDAARAERGGAPALNDVTYDELYAGSLRVAAHLRETGVRRGDRLAIFSENRLGFAFAYLGALRLGAIVVPVNVLYRAAELEHVLSDANVSVVVASETTKPHVAAFPAARIVDAATVEAWASQSTPATMPHPAPGADDDAVIIYTSGTTGRSKGAVMTHGNLAAIASQVVTAWRWSARDTLYAALPLFHTHGLSAGFNGTLASGGRFIFDARFDAATALATLRRDDVTMFFGVPTMYVRLLEALDGEPPALRLWVSGSAALAPDVFTAFEKRFGVQILERYGATEFGFALGNRFGGPRVAGSVGIPLPGVRVRVAERETGTAVPAGEVGELLVGGPSVTRGYWNAPQATAAAFFCDDEGMRWYKSGDLATYDAENEVYRIVGRLKELIITGGFNVYPLEVENELNALPGIRASAVIGAPDPARGELPVAFVECAGELDAEAIRTALGLRLASFKIPREIVAIEHLPRNALGKVEKHRLRDLLAARG
ncbi:MAG: AMP-binding protein [Candidatus Eremiobacteraeota bacterium]|nr:AMP-binding protein [Candidatus Eremiobacteraeota bacterium]